MPGNAANAASQQGGSTGTPNRGGLTTSQLSQSHLDNQGHLQPCAADNAKAKQTEKGRQTKPPEPEAAKKGASGRPATRGVEVEPLS